MTLDSTGHALRRKVMRFGNAVSLAGQEQEMKLYGFTMAPNPRRVRMFLAEKGI